MLCLYLRNIIIEYKKGMVSDTLLSDTQVFDSKFTVIQVLAIQLKF